MDYLNDQEDIAVMRSKNQRFNPLKDTKAFTRSILKILNIVGIPVLFILFGVYIWFRRKSRRRVIQAMFSKKA
jgi:ABC-2 type transport system permease protein